MKRAMWLAGIAIFVFVLDWCIIGLNLLDGNYEITVGAYIGLACIAVIFVCIVYIKWNSRCPHCGKLRLYGGRYCAHCGKRLDDASV